MYASNTHCHCIDSVQSWFNCLWLSKCPPSLAVDCIDGSVYSWHEQCPVILLFLHVQNMSKLEKKTQVWGRRAKADSWQCTQHMPKQRCHSPSCSTASSRTVDIHSKKQNGIQTSDSELPQQVWFHTNQYKSMIHRISQDLIYDKNTSSEFSVSVLPLADL